MSGHTLEKTHVSVKLSIITRVSVFHLESGDGGHQDQATVIGQMLVSLLGDKKLSLNIHSEDVIDFSFSDGRNTTEVLNTGVAQDNIQASKLLHDFLENRLNIGLLRDIRLDGNGSNAK